MGSLASDFKGLEEVFAAGFSPTLAFNTDPFLGGAGEPGQAKVGVHAGTLHVHGVHLHVVIKGELLACPDGSCGKESDAGKPLIEVVYEDVVHLEVGVTLGKKEQWEGEEGPQPAPPDPRPPVGYPHCG